MANKKPTFKVADAVGYLKHTSLIISAFLRDNKLPLSMEKEVEKEVKKFISCCDDCGTWESKLTINHGLCEECENNI